MSRRTRHDLYYEILKLLGEEHPRVATIISDAIHANFGRTRKYLSDLKDGDLIRSISEQGQVKFELTAKGERAKNLFDELWSMLGEVEDD